MSEAWLGIDLGTSAVKALCVYADGRVVKSRWAYDSLTPEGWYDAAAKAVKALDTSCVQAVSLSSQVGTYIVNGSHVLHWNGSEGRNELSALKAKYDAATFLREIGMPHPDIISYPIPRLMHIREKYGENAQVMQPKEYLGVRLTGELFTDVWSWRGLAHGGKGAYSSLFMEEAGSPKLPLLKGCTDMLGKVTAQAAKETGLCAGTPVYTGLNDFFASLLGMGITEPGMLFDITGTSEHLGILLDEPALETPMVTGPCLRHFVHYGVTASSGASLKFGEGAFGKPDDVPQKETIRKAPVFLPYVNGERAPIFDSDARGMFFGIEADTTPEMMAYAVREGVVFSLYHIYTAMGMPKAEKMLVSGGASNDPVLNGLKSELFGMELLTPEETETSALGAAMTAAVGSGAFAGLQEAVWAFCRQKTAEKPRGELRSLLLERFSVYRELYPQVKDTMKKFQEVRKCAV